MDLTTAQLDLKGNNLVGVTDLYVADQIFHTGDTDTYIQFHAANQFRIVTGGTEMLEVNDTNIQLGANLNVNNKVLNNVEDIELNDRIYHDGDSDTYIQFSAADNFRVVTAGGERMNVNNSGVRCGDTGNGRFEPVSGNYGSIEIDGGAHGGWEGFSIGGRSVFMHNNGSAQGIYNDVNNEWLFYGVSNSYTRMYHNGSVKIETTSYGASVSGNVRSQSTAKIWTNFESIGTLSVRDSLNQSSVTDLGTGYFRSNFSSNIANSSYAVAGISGGLLPNYASRVVFPQAYATSSFAFRTEWQPQQGYYDSDYINIMIMGD